MINEETREKKIVKCLWKHSWNYDRIRLTPKTQLVQNADKAA